jgi:hypothetical protein
VRPSLAPTKRELPSSEIGGLVSIFGELIDGMFGRKEGTDGPKREPRIVDDCLS